MSLRSRVILGSSRSRKAILSSKRTTAFLSRSRSTQSSPERITLSCQKQALSSAESIKARYPNVASTDLKVDELARNIFLTPDVLNLHPYHLMRASLQSHLPEARHKYASTADWLHLGHHQVFFRPKLYPKQMLSDGTDTKFIPGNASIWQYRLWAGGSTVYNLERPLNLAQNQSSHQLEYIQDIRVVGEHRPEKVFVTVRRVIANSNHNMRGLPKLEVHKRLSGMKRPPIEEIYTLCFLREPPGDPVDRKTIPPPKDALYSRQVIPDSNLLFHFSALTYNAHKIHLSSEFAKAEYGMKHIVVHGPLTQLLIAEFMRCAITTHSNTSPKHAPFIKSIQYTNLKPLYADEPMTLCCKPLKLNPGQEPWQAESWRVWVQTGEGDSAAMAVKAVIEVGLAAATSSAVREVERTTPQKSTTSQMKKSGQISGSASRTVKPDGNGPTVQKDDLKLKQNPLDTRSKPESTGG